MQRRPLLFHVLAIVFLLTACQEEDLGTINVPSVRADQSADRLVARTNRTWMTVLDDNRKLSTISIPGTHDSGARFDPPFLSGTAKCQNLTLAEQLEAGIRYLDIRCRHIDNSFAIHHGAIYQNINFDDVRNACIDFLQNNPGETIIMSVKEEHTPDNNTQSFEATFDRYVQESSDRWYLNAEVPTLRTVRGKIVLLRRFSGSQGIDATNWADNTTFDINTGQAALKVQDQYVVPNNDDKWNAINALLDEAVGGSSDRLYLNYTSGYKPRFFGIPDINAVANTINPRVRSYFTGREQARFGVIVMDFAETSLSEPIIEMNF